MNRVATLMAAAIAVLLVSLLSLVWQLQLESSRADRLSEEIRALHGELADKSKRDALEAQKECDLQAAKVFDRLGWKLNDPKGIFADFQSHYNISMNKCFMVVRTLTPGADLVLASSALYDAYEQRVYADLELTKSGTAQSHVAVCVLHPPQRDQSFCQSEAEFKSFVAHYMESATLGPLDP